MTFLQWKHLNNSGNCFTVLFPDLKPILSGSFYCSICLSSSRYILPYTKQNKIFTSWSSHICIYTNMHVILRLFLDILFITFIFILYSVLFYIKTRKLREQQSGTRNRSGGISLKKEYWIIILYVREHKLNNEKKSISIFLLVSMKCKIHGVFPFFWVCIEDTFLHVELKMAFSFCTVKWNTLVQGWYFPAKEGQNLPDLL